MTSLPILHHLGHAFIRASAGTGKTHALTTRYAQWVESGIAPQNIIAITFTRRAAAELRTRIRAALLGQGAGDAMLGQLAHAPITNFHGLCLALCEEFWPGGVGEGAVQVLGESGEDKQLFVESCESKWFCGNPALARALQAVSPFMAIDGALMGRLWEALSLARESAQPLTEQLFGRYDAQAAALSAQEQLYALRQRILNHEHELGTPAGLRAVAHLKETPVPALPESAAHYPVWQQGWRAMFAPINRKGRMGRIIDAEQLEAVATLLPSVVAEQWAAQVAPALFTLAQAAWLAYAAAKAARGALDFADLIERAISLLSERPEVYRIVRERTAAVLVDEAQDTNALQRRLVCLLAGLQGGEHPPAATTVVGDWKQAIYTFRGADPENFSRFASDLESLGGVEENLATSYRSVAPLVDGINHLGRHLFEAAYEPLVPLERCASAVRALGAEPPPEEATATARQGMHWLAVRRSDGRRLTLADDAWATAQHVAKLVQGGTKPQDIAILLANVRSAAPTYLRAFAEAQVPLIASGSGDLLEQPHVAEIMALCAWLVDGSDSRAIEGAIALSAPLFALDDDALYFLWGPEGRALQRVRALRTGDVAALAAGSNAPLPMVLQRACALVPELIALAARCPMPIMLERLDAHLHVRALYGAEPSARAQRLADFDALVRLASQAQRRGCGGVADCVSHLMWRKSQGFTTSQGEGSAAQEQAVWLSSVHGSKGLQYPIVVLPALERRGQNAAHALVFERQSGVSFALQNGRERLRPQRFVDATKAIAAAQSAELKRLVYVAITRAKQQVIFIGPPAADCGATGFASIVAPWAAQASSVMQVSEITVPPACVATPAPTAPWLPDASPTAATVVAAEAAHLPKLLPSLSAAAKAPVSAPGATLALSVSALLDVWQPQEGTAEPDVTLLDALDPFAATLDHQRAGILAHKLMARLDDLPSFATMQQFIQAELLFLGHDPSNPSIRAVGAVVAAALEAPLGLRLRAVAAHARIFEQEFVWRGHAGGHALQLRGQVDALVMEGSGLTMIDFKYGRPSASDLRYAQQLQIYAWALKKLRGSEQAPNRALVFYLKEPEATRTISIDDASCQWVPHALASWVAKMTEPPGYAGTA